MASVTENNIFCKLVLTIFFIEFLPNTNTVTVNLCVPLDFKLSQLLHVVMLKDWHIILCTAKLFAKLSTVDNYCILLLHPWLVLASGVAGNS